MLEEKYKNAFKALDKCYKTSSVAFYTFLKSTKRKFFTLEEILIYIEEAEKFDKEKIQTINNYDGLVFDVYGNFYFGAPIYVNYINKSETAKEVILIEDLEEYLYYHPFQNEIVIDFSKKGKERRKIKKLVKSFIKNNNLDCTLK
jgi:hypothetical protein